MVKELAAAADEIMFRLTGTDETNRRPTIRARL